MPERCAPPEARGVSVVIPSHNGETRLPGALAHLLRQRVTGGLPWEVVVVDNASTDGTRRAALAAWPASAPAPLRVVEEPRLGLAHARRCGVEASRYDIVSFIDDDNGVAPDWIELSFRLMQAHPRAGACGGHNEGVFEAAPPAWFARFQQSYAVGPQARRPGDVDTLWGAGLNVRRAAWAELAGCGHRGYLVGRRGRDLAGGEDTELCLMLRLAGWTLRYDPRLRLTHALSARRLTWDHLCALQRGFGVASVQLAPYHAVLGSRQTWLPGRWGYGYVAILPKLLRYLTWCRASRRERREGAPQALAAEWTLAQFAELRRTRHHFRRRVRFLKSLQRRLAGPDGTGS